MKVKSNDNFRPYSVVIETEEEHEDFIVILRYLCLNAVPLPATYKKLTLEIVREIDKLSEINESKVEDEQ